MEPRPPAGRWQAHFLLLACVWGLSFVFIKVGDRSLTPIQVTMGRLAVGAATLLLIAAVRREGLPRSLGTWAHLAVAALLVNVVPFTLIAYGETQVTSVLAGIWNATTPLLTAMVALLVLREERPTRQRAAGLALGFLGVLVVMGVWRGVGGGALVGSLACLGAAACYGTGFPYLRRFVTSRGHSSLSLSAAQLLVATVLIAPAAPLSGPPPRDLALAPLASVGLLGAFGTGVAYILNYAVIRRAGATVASTVTYVVPLFSTFAGVLLLREPLSWNQPLGGAVILAGVALAQGPWRGLRPPPAPSESGAGEPEPAARQGLSRSAPAPRRSPPA
jgi:drug/metabolite transporter (DMT)-like permease